MLNQKMDQHRSSPVVRAFLVYAIVFVGLVYATIFLGVFQRKQLPSFVEVPPRPANPRSTNLSVPFYMYPTDQFLGYTACGDIRERASAKHNHDIYFLQALQNHPWSVSPEQAVIFVVPLLVDHICTRMCGKDPVKVFKNARNVLERSPWFQKCQGCDHLVVGAAGHPCKANFFKHIPHVILGADEFSRYQPVRCALSVGDTTLYASMHPNITPNNAPILPQFIPFENRSNFLTFMGQAKKKGHSGYKIREVLLTTKKPFNFSVWITTSSPEFETVKTCAGNDRDRCFLRLSLMESQRVMEDSKFALVLRGDTYGTDRIFNAFAAKSLIVYVDDASDHVLGIMPFANIIPWRDILIRISSVDFEKDPVAELNKLKTIPAHLLQYKLDLMELYMGDLDWAHPRTRMAENILWEAVYPSGNTSKHCKPLTERREIQYEKGFSFRDLLVRTKREAKKMMIVT
eukprot:Lithocolla_globosa_v1_NODE_560_length_3748_cov_17.769022.p1 type:complete len:459 gc:universal NODE_560_length_3748_cov_17.769022:2036-660(-)